MILYFSATGNSRYVAERIAESIGDTAVSMENVTEKHLGEGERVLGLVSPTYAFMLPRYVTDFLAEHTLVKAPYTFFTATYGTTPGATWHHAAECMEKAGARPDAWFSVRMPDTWTPIFDLSDPERVKQTNEAAERELTAVAEKVKAQIPGNQMDRRMPRIALSVCRPYYEAMRKTNHFRVEDRCIGCGLCERKCPVQAIEMRDGNPYWIKERCTMCLGCLHRCPVFAIQYGSRTKVHGQYLHPGKK